MQLRWLIVLLAICSNLLANPGSTQTVDFHSATLDRDWRYKIYLPEGYDFAEVSYPVIYLLHGSGGDENAWDPVFPLLDSLIAAEIIPPVIAVAPASGTSWWTDGKEPFETAFFADLQPDAEQRFRISSERSGRMVAGYSMGGYSALRYALAHPQMFAAATILSPALYSQQPPPESSARTSGAFGTPFDSSLWENWNYPAVLTTYLAQDLRVPIYIACGDDDWNHPEGFEYNMEQQSVLLYGILNRKSGSPAELRIVNGGHNWKLWKPQFINGLKYMLQSIR
ncbi:MAG: esterase family protein [Calditrichaeota bacterium]|nr:esterase family protein [Calditrichota bacterium]MCB0268736.1 esterase family protein [Calditrichota bacterium]